MSMDAARSRFPECAYCGRGVDENDPDRKYVVLKNTLLAHLDCYRQEKQMDEDDEAYQRSVEAELP